MNELISVSVNDVVAAMRAVDAIKSNEERLAFGLVEAIGAAMALDLPEVEELLRRAHTRARRANDEVAHVFLALENPGR